MKKIIQAIDVKKSFERGGNIYEVVRGVDLDVFEGEFVAIVGESGSGKSTLLYLLSGADKPSSGKVHLLDTPLDEIDADTLAKMRRQRFSFVYQYDNLVSNLTSYENIVLPLFLDKKKVESKKDDIKEIIRYLHLDSALEKYPRELSGGEQQRVALARALVIEPELIFLDEPTGSLDTAMGAEVMELLKDINKNRNVTLVMVTHSKQHAKYASRVVEIVDGKLQDKQNN